MTNTSNPNQQPAHGHETAPEQKQIPPRLALVAVAVLLIAALVFAGLGILRRTQADECGKKSGVTRLEA
jgi:hypothetical protein